MSEAATEQEATPVFEVVSGNPTPEELAAVVSVLTLVTSAAPTTPDKQPRIGGWRSHWRSVRRYNVPRRGGDAWRNYHRL